MDAPKQVIGKPLVELQDGDQEKEARSAIDRPFLRFGQFRPATDIEAVLTVLGRREEEARRRDAAIGRRLDLRETDLRGATLCGAKLQGARLSGANLEGADLHGADLEDADLQMAHLECADLCNAKVKRALLRFSHFEGADLFAEGLIQNQLDSVVGNEKAMIALEYLTRPAHWLEGKERDDWLKREARLLRRGWPFPTTPPPCPPPLPETPPDTSNRR